MSVITLYRTKWFIIIVLEREEEGVNRNESHIRHNKRKQGEVTPLDICGRLYSHVQSQTTHLILDVQ